MHPKLLTIGYGTRDISAFIELLVRYKVDVLADVRSVPHSRFMPQYNKQTLTESLAQAGIKYLFLGDQLGGRPKCPHCYSNNGKVIYSIVAEQNFFREGLTRLQNGLTKGYTITLMCSELKPSDCHRSKLIGVEMDKQNYTLCHIDENGELLTQKDVMSLLTESPQHNKKKLPEQQSLFDQNPFSSRKSY